MRQVVSRSGRKLAIFKGASLRGPSFQDPIDTAETAAVHGIHHQNI